MTTVSDFVDEVVAVHQSHARPAECPLIEWLKAQRGRDEDEVRVEMIAHPAWSSLYARDGLISAGERFEGEKRRAVQTLHADYLIQRNNRKLAPFIGALVAIRPEIFDEAVAARLSAWAR